MPKPVVLAVINDETYYRQMCLELDKLLVARPVHLTSGEDGVLWVGANQCDLCVIDYDLPDIDGLETLLRMRQRNPRMPAIITSDANDERIAVSAFRQGIVDYMARSEIESPKALAERIKGFVDSLGTRGQQEFQRRAVSVPPELREPTYQNLLRVIGRQLDRDRYR